MCSELTVPLPLKSNDSSAVTDAELCTGGFGTCTLSCVSSPFKSLVLDLAGNFREVSSPVKHDAGDGRDVAGTKVGANGFKTCPVSAISSPD